MDTIRIDSETIAERLRVALKTESGRSRTCEKHEKRLRRPTPVPGEKPEPQWVISVGTDAITLVGRLTCGHSKDPCWDRVAVDVAIRAGDGSWTETEPKHKSTIRDPAEVNDIDKAA